MAKKLLWLVLGTIAAEGPLFGAQDPAVARDRLTVTELFERDVHVIVHNDYFKPIGTNEPPSHLLSGRIHLSETTMATPLPDADWQGSGQRIFPGFAVSVVGHGRDLIPLERGIILSGERAESIWNVIVSMKCAGMSSPVFLSLRRPVSMGCLTRQSTSCPSAPVLIFILVANAIILSPISS